MDWIATICGSTKYEDHHFSIPTSRMFIHGEATPGIPYFQQITITQVSIEGV